MKAIYGFGKLIRRACFIIFMSAFSMLMLMPIIWMFSTSLRLPKDSFRLPPAFFPDNWHWSNYVDAWNSVPYGRFIMNSLTISITSVVAVIVITTMAAYSFSRIKFPGRDIIFLFFLSGIMIPAQSTLIPRFFVISRMGLVNNRLALILPALIYPMGIFLIRQYMMTIPASYDEAAYMDGAGRFRIFIHVICPMAVPAMTVVGVLHFLGTWNDFLNALIFLYNPQSMTLPLGVNLLKGYHGTGSPAVVLAGVMMSMLVPLLVYGFGQKYLLRGANIAGLKS